jgi:hypothetical protein
MKILKWLACRIFGHGPFNDGRMGTQEGKFCLVCDEFIPSPPAAH